MKLSVRNFMEGKKKLADEIIRSNVNKEKAVAENKKDNVKLGGGLNISEKKKGQCC